MAGSSSAGRIRTPARRRDQIEDRVAVQGILRPMIDQLRSSAMDLFRRMIAPEPEPR